MSGSGFGTRDEGLWFLKIGGGDVSRRPRDFERWL